MKKLYTFIRLFLNSIYYFTFKDTLVVSAWVNVIHGKVVQRNWGDELNVYLLELLTTKKVIIANNSLWHILFPCKKFICIGSILGWYETERAEIWGAGALSKNVVIKSNKAKIHLVRGKYTRQLLLQQGVVCPEIYGDPALLLSKLYCPNITKRYRMGIIPHYSEEDQLYIHNYVNDHDDVCLISMSKYKEWTEIIDKIASCDFVISSSLHGLIVSDSYHVPNIWVSFSEDTKKDDNFKYKDYFSSVKRDESQQPIIIRSESELIDLYNCKYEDICENPDVNYDNILKSCPFL